MNKMMKKLLLPMLIMVLMFGILAACGNKEEVQTPVTENPVESTPVQDQAAESTVDTAFPVTLTDADGVEFTIEKQPERIISLIPSNTEIAYALGLGDAVVGVNDYDTYPPEVLEKEKIGSMPYNIEKIISLQPDLVLAHASAKNSSEDGFKQIAAAGIPVVMIHNEASIADVYQTIELIAKATGTSNTGSQIIADMKATFADYEQKAKAIAAEEQALVWVEVDPTLFTTGQGTYIHEMLELLHAKNAAGDQAGWLQFTEEEVVAMNPDVIITTYGVYTPDVEQTVLGRTGWENVSAIQNKRVHDVDPDTVTRSGPRLTKGIEELAKAIYPEIFAK